MNATQKRLLFDFYGIKSDRDYDDYGDDLDSKNFEVP